MVAERSQQQGQHFLIFHGTKDIARKDFDSSVTKNKKNNMLKEEGPSFFGREEK